MKASLEKQVSGGGTQVDDKVHAGVVDVDVNVKEEARDVDERWATQPPSINNQAFYSQASWGRQHNLNQ
jgi:hypothetical protein